MNGKAVRRTEENCCRQTSTINAFHHGLSDDPARIDNSVVLASAQGGQILLPGLSTQTPVGAGISLCLVYPPKLQSELAYPYAWRRRAILQLPINNQITWHPYLVTMSFLTSVTP